MSVIPLFAALFSVLVPAKMWYGIHQANEVRNDGKDDVSLVLTDFAGKQLAAKGSTDLAAGKTTDAKAVFPQLSTLGTYVLYAVPKGKQFPTFAGTPLVFEVRGDKEGLGKPSATHVKPLQYVMMETSQGPIKMVFYYDVAPLTVDNFLRLSEQGYYNGLTFHRIVPSFVIQGGDPRGDGTGGPGYTIDAEFNDRPHTEGVLSMARTSEPNTAGSQFFVCLDYKQTKNLDHKYTAFGKVVDGMNAVNAIAGVPLANKDGNPREPQVIKGVTVKPVTEQDNPYAGIFQGAK